MAKEFLTDEIRKIANSLNRISESTGDDTENRPSEDPLAANAKNKSTGTNPKVGTVASDAKANAAVDDIMTHEKGPVKLQGSIAVKSLAQALGIQNTNLFAAAFNALKQGKIPNNQAQVRELAIAFDKLLAADSSTTGKVLNQLRRIHKAS